MNMIKNYVFYVTKYDSYPDDYLDVCFANKYYNFENQRELSRHCISNLAPVIAGLNLAYADGHTFLYDGPLGVEELSSKIKEYGLEHSQSFYDFDHSPVSIEFVERDVEEIMMYVDYIKQLQ